MKSRVLRIRVPDAAKKKDDNFVAMIIDDDEEYDLFDPKN